MLHQHDKKSPAIGFVTSARVEPSKGVYGTCVLPKPEVGTKAMEIYSAVKNGLVKGFSVGGFWQRYQDGLGRTKLKCKRLLEVSLTGLPVNEYALADGGITAVQGVKSIGSEWLTVPDYDQRLQDAQEWLAAKRAERQLALIDLRLTVAELRRA